MKNASNSQTFRDLNEHRRVFDVQYAAGWRLSDVQREPKHFHVGLARMDEAGGNEGIHESVQLELVNPIRVHFSRFVADDGDPQRVARLQIANHLDHLDVRFRLREHEEPKLRPGERPLFVEDYPI